MQADLADKKDLLTKLNERLYQLNEVCIAFPNDVIKNIVQRANGLFVI